MKSLPVWAIEAAGSYCGGVAIVAARTQQEAIKLAVPLETYPWRIGWNAPTAVKLLPLTYRGAPTVLHHYCMGE